MGLPRSAIQILIALGEGERHGYGIMRAVEEATGGAVKLGPGTLYRCLKDLVDAGAIERAEVDEPPRITHRKHFGSARERLRAIPRGRDPTAGSPRKAAYPV